MIFKEDKHRGNNKLYQCILVKINDKMFLEKTKEREKKTSPQKQYKPEENETRSLKG